LGQKPKSMEKCRVFRRTLRSLGGIGPGRCYLADTGADPQFVDDLVPLRDFGRTPSLTWPISASLRRSLRLQGRAGKLKIARDAYLALTRFRRRLGKLWP
jgi:hypothetical protein